jgi:SpoVK/Ycf46/Vps4 family AAA+-type ATPase
MPTTVFDSQENNQQETPAQEPQPNSEVNVFADQLSTITNEEGKPKYNSVETALEALKHSQQFIPTLQQEKIALEAQVATLSEQVAQNKGVQDVIDKLTNREQEHQPADQQAPTFTAEDVAALVDKQLNQRSTADTHKANATKVHEALVEKFGTEASAKVAAKAKELGTTPEQLGKLATESPAMVMALFGTTAKQTSATQTSYNFDSTPQEKERLGRPEKSLMFGATNKESAEFFKKIRDEVYADFDIQE